jgi:DNA-binding response OmpR family regulator
MKLLIVEDELPLLNDIKAYFADEHFVCEGVDTYELAVEKISLYEYDCLLVDITLPDGNGLDLLSLLKTLKKSQGESAPGIIIISAKNALDDRIRGLDLGADDYLTKPFHLSELNARLKAIIRRRNFATTDQLTVGHLRIDPLGRQAWSNDSILNLTPKQWAILLHLLANRTHVVSKSSLAEHLWGDHIDQADSFDFLFAHIKNLKKRLVGANAGIEIRTVYGVGYQLIEL